MRSRLWHPVLVNSLVLLKRLASQVGRCYALERPQVRMSHHNKSAPASYFGKANSNSLVHAHSKSHVMADIFPNWLLAS